MTYCGYIRTLRNDEVNVHREYHDNEYGFPLPDDNELFGRLILEINQAGLSWTTILNKQKNFRKAYRNFNVKKVAGFKDKDFKRLMEDAGIIRNRLKINAAIENAKTVLRLQKEFGSFKNWINSHHPKTKQEWTKIFKSTFIFTGGEIVNEFLLSTGYLPGAHDKDCPVYKKVIRLKPMWSLKSN